MPVVRKAREERRVQEHQHEQERQAREAQTERDRERARSEELQRQRDTANHSLKAATRNRTIALALAIVSVFVSVAAVLFALKVAQTRRTLALAVSTSNLAEGRLGLPAGSEPWEQKVYRGLAAYRLAEGEMSQARNASRTALFSVLDISGHLRKAVQIRGLVPTPALAYSPDGKTLAVGGEDGLIRLLQTEDYHETASLDCGQRTESVWTLAFNSDGTRLAAGYATDGDENRGNGLVCVFDVPKGNGIRQYKPFREWSGRKLWGKSGSVYSVAYGGQPGAEFVISGGSDKMLRMLDTQTTAMSEIRHHAAVVGLALSADGLTVVSGGDDKVIRVWNLADFGDLNATPQRTLEGHDAGIEQVVFSPADPSVLVSAADDGRIIVWDVKTGCLVQQSQPQEGGTYNIAVHPRGEMVAAAGLDGKVRLFQLEKRDSPCGTPNGKGASSTVPNPPNLSLISDGLLIGHGGSSLGVAFNPDGTRLASTGTEGSTLIWGPNTVAFSLAQLQLDSSASLTEPAGVTILAVSPDGKSIAAGDEKGNIRQWDRPKKDAEPMTLSARATWSAHEKAVRSLVYILIGNRLALVSGGDDGVLKRWDAASRDVIGPEIADSVQPVRSIALSPDGKTIAVGRQDGTIRLWDAATGKPGRKFDKPKAATDNYKLSAVGFSSDGKHLAVGSTLSGLRVLSLEKPDGERVLQGANWGVTAISRRGAAGKGGGKDSAPWLLSAGADGRVLEWEQAALGQPSAEGLKKQDEFKYSMESRDLRPLTSIDASADGGLILTGGKGGQVQLWDGAEHVLIGERFRGHEKDIRAVALAPDGSFFVTADTSTILLWPGPKEWPDIICSKLSWNMSLKQWSDWVSPGIPYKEQCPNLMIAPDEANRRTGQTIR